MQTIDYRNVLGVALAAALLAACGSSPKAPQEPVERVQALDFLPQSAMGVLYANDPRALRYQLGWAALTERHRALYEKAVAELVQETGYDLFDFDALAQHGVDPGGPAGMAAFPSDNVVIFFGTLSDQDAFKTALYKSTPAKATKFEAEVVGEGVVIGTRAHGDWRFVLRDKTVFLVVRDRSDQDAAQIAHKLATAEPGQGLAAEPAFAAAVAGVASARPDVVAYVAAREGLDQLSNMLGGGGAPVAFGLSVAADRAELVGFSPLPADAPLRALLRPDPPPRAIMAGLERAPLVMLHTTIDPSAIDKLPLGQMLDLPPGFGIDLRKDLLPLVAGTIGFAVEPTRPLDQVDAPGPPIGGHLAVALTDPAKARATLTRLFQAPPLSQLVQTQGEDRWRIPQTGPNDPEWHIGLAGTVFFVSTSAGFAERMSGGAPAWATPGLVELMNADGASARAVLDLGMLTMFMLRSSSASDIAAYSAAAKVGDQVAADPKLLEQKRAELAAAREELVKLQVERERRVVSHAMKMVERIGLTGVQVAVGEPGLTVRGVQFTGEGGPEGVLSDMIAMALEGEAEDDAMSSAYERVWDLERELQALESPPAALPPLP